jgi:hypothetical protein
LLNEPSRFLGEPADTSDGASCGRELFDWLSPENRVDDLFRNGILAHSRSLCLSPSRKDAKNALAAWTDDFGSEPNLLRRRPMEAFAELFERFRFFVIRRGPSRHR